MAKIFPRALEASCTVNENHHCPSGSRVPVTFSPAQTDLFTYLSQCTSASLLSAHVQVDEKRTYNRTKVECDFKDKTEKKITVLDSSNDVSP